MSRRLRITYRYGTECMVQSGALARAWVEAFEAAGLPLERPDGSRRPRVEAGPALPTGATGDAEVLDAWLADATPEPDEVCRRLALTAPRGLVPIAAEEIGARLPSLAASLRAATYEVDFAAGSVIRVLLEERVASFLAQSVFELDEVRGERVRRIDLRALVRSLVVREEQDRVRLEMRVVLEQERSGRPSTVLAALSCGEAPYRLVRRSVEVEAPRVALRAWRGRGRFS